MQNAPFAKLILPDISQYVHALEIDDNGRRDITALRTF